MPHERLRPEYDFDQERIDSLREIVPEAFADGKINWTTLKEADSEHFGLFWPGKREARRLASIPSTGTRISRAYDKTGSSRLPRRPRQPDR